MTREEAIKHLQGMRDEAWSLQGALCYINLESIKALDMAIEALSADTVATIQTGQTYGKSAYIKELAEVVRCKDCRHRDLFSCPLADNDFQKDDDYCSWGERREE